MGWIEDLSTDWEREYPGVDTGSLPPMVRLARLSVLIEGFQQKVLAPFQLTSGDYGVLAALRRAGAPYQLSPSKLYGRLQRSSGGMTKTLKKLEEQKLIERAKDPRDGRGSVVSLTAAGVELQDRVFHEYVSATQQLLEPLLETDLGETDRVLGKVLDTFERGVSR